jgi:ribosome-binding factor A
MDHRTERISEALREELSELIGYEMSDPRVASVVVTDVHISPDKRHAHVRVGVPADGSSKDALKALDGAKQFLRLQLAKRLEVYRIPELHFQADLLAESSGRMEHLLKRMKKGRPRESPPDVTIDNVEKKAVE